MSDDLSPIRLLEVVPIGDQVRGTGVRIVAKLDFEVYGLRVRGAELAEVRPGKFRIFLPKVRSVPPETKFVKFTCPALADAMTVAAVNEHRRLLADIEP